MGQSLEYLRSQVDAAGHCNEAGILLVSSLSTRVHTSSEALKSPFNRLSASRACSGCSPTMVKQRATPGRFTAGMDWKRGHLGDAVYDVKHHHSLGRSEALFLPVQGDGLNADNDVLGKSLALFSIISAKRFEGKVSYKQNFIVRLTGPPGMQQNFRYYPYRNLLNAGSVKSVKYSYMQSMMLRTALALWNIIRAAGCGHFARVAVLSM